MRYVAIESVVPADERSLKLAHGASKDLPVGVKTAPRLAPERSFLDELT